jgi:hypothetical protein
MAMVLVCLSHFATVYFRPRSGATVHHFAVDVGMIASPTFIAVSGMMVGLLSVTYRAGFTRLRTKLIDRALFILVVAHWLIAMSRLSYEAVPTNALRMTFMTDAVAISMLLGVSLVTWTPAAFRIGLGIIVFPISWVLILAWHTTGAASGFVKDVLVGGIPNAVLPYSVPLLPWFAVYIISTVLGQRFGALFQAGEHRAIERLAVKVTAAMLSLGIGLRVVGWILRPTAHTAALEWRFEPLFSPWSKLPPGPVYVLFFGGLGFALVTAMLVVSHRRLLPWVSQWFATLGRASLAVFTVQFYLYYTLLGSAHLAQHRWWPLLFLLSLLPLFWFARFWDRHRLNDRLTLGLRAWLSRDARTAAQAA